MSVRFASDRQNTEDGVITAIGKTPLIRLRRLFDELIVYAKLEMLNPAGSVKDRAAAHIVKSGIDSGEIDRSTVVVESTSGNMGIGLAQVCAYYGIRFIAVVDSRTTSSNIAILKAYGAQVEVVSQPDPVTGELLQARLARVKALLAAHPKSYWPNQYANILNARAHHATMREILEVLDGHLDYLFCATSTCGTAMGCAEFLKEKGMATKIVAVDAVGSMIFGCNKGRRLIPGHGASLRPHLLNEDQIDARVHVSDAECVRGCRELISKEGIFAGGSSGGVIAGIQKYKSLIPAGKVCAMIAPDRGERYIDTIYDDQWVADHFLD